MEMASSDPSNSQAAPFSSMSFDEYNTQLQSAALKATKNAISLPTDLAFHRSMDSEFSTDLDAFSSRVLLVTNKLLALASTADTSQAGRGKGKLKLENQDDVLDNFHSLIVDSMDQLLERADISLDEYLGRSKPPAIAINPAKPAVQKKPNAPRGRLDPALQHASHLPKPQAKFKRKVDNDNNSPWHPVLPHKYNAQVPLGYSYRTDGDADGDNLPLHPYRYEIMHISYPARLFQSAKPIPPRSFDDTPFTWVDTPHLFQDMLEKLRKASEIAVDLEHHSYRSFSGFLCLMQISTREEDWVVDCLALREEVPELNEVFTDPAIVKVFHGAESDIVWLQQDFGLYIVNLFDTYHASKVLDFPRHGLANLLEMYCDFTPDKRYQLADWRIRPLPEEMLHYARSDTHFLLYIYDSLRNALLDRAQSRAQSPTSRSQSRGHSPAVDSSQAYVREVLKRSEETALRTYEKEVYDAEDGQGPGGWDTLARKWNKGLMMSGEGTGGMQREVYKCVHAWRDRVARQEDESTRYVLPNHYLFQLAERPPADMAALMSMFQAVPPVLKRRAKELLDAIKDTVKESGGGTDISSQPSRSTAIGESSSTSTDDVAIGTEPKVSADADTTTHSSRLWSTPQPGVASASSSSLFGSALQPRNASTIPQASTSYATARSLLFGGKASLPATSASENSHFRELVIRIHSKLVIAPSIPKIMSNGTDNHATAWAVQEVKAEEDIAMQEPPRLEDATEIPFIPAAQRRIADVVDDSIVVVGQVRQKKRKRVKASLATTPDPDSSTTGGPIKIKSEPQVVQDGESGSSTPQEAFDYSSVPNILDDVPPPDPDSKQRRKKKQKQNKGGVFEYGNFPAPPKAHRELKSGNQSQTFK